jgi:hypothetical protein
VLEDSVESFIARWGRYAAQVRLFPHVEGSPLLECEAAGRIFHVFERTNPYGSPVGEAKMIVHGVTMTVTIGGGESYLNVPGTSCLELGGRLSHVSERVIVVEAGIPVVVGLLELPGRPLAVGNHVELTLLPPLHGFVLDEAPLNRVAADDI